MKIIQLASKYDKIQEDGRLLSNKASIGVIDQRIHQLLERMEEAYDPKRLKTLEKLWQEYKFAKVEDRTRIARQIDDEFDKEFHDYEAFDQFLKATEVKRKAIDSEIKILKELDAVLTAEQAAEMVAQMFAACKRVLMNDDFTKYPIGKRLQMLKYEFGQITGSSISDEPESDIIDV